MLTITLRLCTAAPQGERSHPGWHRIRDGIERRPEDLSHLLQGLRKGCGEQARLSWVYEALTELGWLAPCAMKQRMQDFPGLHPGVLKLHILQESTMPSQFLGLEVSNPCPRSKVRSLHRTVSSYIDTSDPSRALWYHFVFYLLRIKWPR